MVTLPVALGRATSAHQSRRAGFDSSYNEPSVQCTVPRTSIIVSVDITSEIDAFKVRATSSTCMGFVGVDKHGGDIVFFFVEGFDLINCRFLASVCRFTRLCAWRSDGGHDALVRLATFNFGFTSQVAEKRAQLFNDIIRASCEFGSIFDEPICAFALGGSGVTRYGENFSVLVKSPFDCPCRAALFSWLQRR